MRAKALIVLVFVALTVLIAITVPTKVGASTLPSNCDVWAGLCLQFNVLTPHFAIFYNTTGPFSVTDSWAHNVSIMAENAYDRLVVKDGFDPPARNPLPIYLDLTDGGFTTLIESDLSTLQIEFRTKSPCTPSCGLPTSYFELAHEIFHAIQYTEHDGQISFGRWLSEGSANWAGYEVTGNESRWDPWVVDGWMEPNGTTDSPFEFRTYDTAMFYAFLAEHYGGADIMKRLISQDNSRAEGANELISSQLFAEGFNKTLTDVMNEFGAALVTGNFTDPDGAKTVLIEGPPATGVELVWAGSNITASSFTNSQNGFRVGARLQIRFPFGIEYAKVKMASNQPLSIQLQAENLSCFKESIITNASTGFRVYPLSAELPFAISSPQSYDSIYVSVTRGNCDGGFFNISLSLSRVSPQSPLTSLQASNVVTGLLIAIVATATALLLNSKLRNQKRSPK